jgi:hypothetical protein
MASRSPNQLLPRICNRSGQLDWGNHMRHHVTGCMMKGRRAGGAGHQSAGADKRSVRVHPSVRLVTLSVRIAINDQKNCEFCPKIRKACGAYVLACGAGRATRTSGSTRMDARPVRAMRRLLRHHGAHGTTCPCPFGAAERSTHAGRGRHAARRVGLV